MAMRRETAVQDDLVASWAEIPRSPGHAFYDRLQTLLKEAGFDVSSRTPASRTMRRGWAPRHCRPAAISACT
jgi:uncharacterized lipoprotein